MQKYDYDELSISLLARIREILPKWLPGGRIVGNEYLCADLRGGHGDSVRINITTGAWTDYTTENKGDDLVALYALIYGLETWKAYERLTKPALEILTPINHPNKFESSTIDTSIQINLSLPDEDSVSMTNKMIWERAGIALTAQGQPVCNLDNALRILQNITEFKNKIWWDDFHQKIFTDWNGNKREWQDVDDLTLTAYVQRAVGIRRISDESIHKAVVLFAHSNKRNEPKDWFNSIIWDQTPRISNYMTKYLGAKESPYIQSVSRNWWISMIARIMNPGCQMRHMVILYGKQETGKSKSLAAVGGNWYCEAHEDVNSNNFFQILQGQLIVEIGELQSFSKAGVTRIKQVVSCATDRYRAPYARLPQNNPRTCVFVGTTNDPKFLDDPTGATRFWPVTTNRIDIDAILRDREQLFAEAVHAFKSSENYWMTPEEETLLEQEKYRRTDEWEYVVSDFLMGRHETSVVEVATQCLSIDLSRLDRSTQMRIARILSQLGWAKRDAWRENRTLKIWFPPELTKQDEIDGW